MNSVALFLVAITATVPPQPSAEELRTLGETVVASLPKGSRLLAACGPSQGVGYYLTPQGTGWVDDPISKGRIVVVASPEGVPNIFFKDATGSVINARDDGAEITLSFIKPEKRSFGLIEHYSSTGVTQTYVFSPSSEGRLTMLWTAAKSHMSVADITKVSAYVSVCA